jgi:hypothetical protein
MSVRRYRAIGVQNIGIIVKRGVAAKFRFAQSAT